MVWGWFKHFTLIEHFISIIIIISVTHQIIRHWILEAGDLCFWRYHPVLHPSPLQPVFTFILQPQLVSLIPPSTAISGVLSNPTTSVHLTTAPTKPYPVIPPSLFLNCHLWLDNLSFLIPVKLYLTLYLFLITQSCSPPFSNCRQLLSLPTNWDLSWCWLVAGLVDWSITSRSVSFASLWCLESVSLGF